MTKINPVRQQLADIVNLDGPLSPVEDALIQICDRLARQVENLERKLRELDNATENARHRTAVYK